MPEYKRWCYESCTKDQAFAGDLGGMKRYWVRLDGECVRYFERERWPEYIEFVRPVEPGCSSEKERQAIADLFSELTDEKCPGGYCLAFADCLLAAGYRKVAKWEVNQ